MARSWLTCVLCVALGLLQGCATNMGKGLELLDSHQHVEALKYFEYDAELGYRVPAIIASELYISDYQIPRNIEKSKYYLDKALKAEYGRYDQLFDYFLPLIKAYQILADVNQPDKSQAIEILQYSKYEEYSWPLMTLAHCYLVGYGVEQDVAKAQELYNEGVRQRLSDGYLLSYAWWLATFPDASFRNPEFALKYALQAEQDEDLQKYPGLYDVLAAVYAIHGDFDRAIATQQTALRKLRESIAAHEYMSRLEPGYLARLAYYESIRPRISGAVVLSPKSA
jgi:TPR repeat protein